MQVDHAPLFAAYDRVEAERRQRTAPRRAGNALQSFLHQACDVKTSNGFQRMSLCRFGPLLALPTDFTDLKTGREALAALDTQGWQRSYHQRLFHDHFIRACARIFWKTEPPGSFARNHQKILEMNGWDHLSQEILVSTPRR